MAVEDVNNPKTVKEVDPRVAKEEGEGSAAYWEKRAAGAKARLDYEDYVNAMGKLGKTPEPGFQIKGSVNLGDINPQAQAKEAQDRADKVIESKDKDIKEANTKATEAENRLQQERIEGLRRDFATQMDTLQKTIEKMTTTKDARPLHEQFKEQYTSVLGLAKDLGLEKTGTGRDPMVDIKLAEMSYENAMREREFKLRMTESDRQWQMNLQKLQDEREARQSEIARQGKRDEMLFQAPQIFGAALAKGLVDSTQGGGAATGDGIQGQPGSPQAFKIQAAEGDSGEFACPVCNTKVGIGPHSDLAQCVECNTTFKVERVSATEAPATEAAEEKSK